MRTFILSLVVLFSASLLAQDINAEIMSGGIQRSFIIHFPNGQVEPDLPVVLILHGDGGTGQGIKGYSGFDSVSDIENFIAVYPNSTNQLGNGIWNKEVNGNPNDGPDDVLFISDIIDYMCENYGVNLNKVYATGHSGGAFMSYHLAVALSDKIAAIAPIAGNMYGDNDFISNYLTGGSFVKIPIYHLHGDNDNTVSYPDPNHQPDDWGEWPLNGFSYPTCGAATYNLANVTDLAPAVKRIPFCENDAESKEILLIRIIGGGHNWPNVAEYNASQAIWSFFDNYQLNINENCQMSVEDLSAAEVNVYPNPVREALTVQSKRPLHSVHIYDLNGRIALEKQINGHTKIEMSVNSLPKGVYVVRVQDAGKHIFTQKIIKK